MSKFVKYERECDNNEGDLNWAHMFPRVHRLKKKSV